MSRSRKILLIVLVVIVALTLNSCLTLLGAFDDYDDSSEDETKITTTDKKSKKEVVPEISPEEQALENYFPKETAKGAIVVAFTNRMAEDVFTEDGKKYDPAKFHDYAYAGQFYQKITKEGEWSYKDEKTWHVEYMYLLMPSSNYATKLICDVSYDGENYVLSNAQCFQAAQPYIESTDPSKTSGWLPLENPKINMYLIVSPSLVNHAPTQEDIDANDHSKDIPEYQALRAFEIYGEALYPYGFKCHWILKRYCVEQTYDGSWIIKVGVTITNQYGAKYDATAGAYINNLTKSVEDFYVY